MQLRSSDVALEEMPAPALEAIGSPARLELPRPGDGTRKLWAGALRQLTSVRLAIGLLIALGVAAAFGTFFPALDLYHSLPFTALLAALGLNIAVCSMRRMTTLVRASGQEADPVDDNVQEHAALRDRFELPGGPAEVVERVRRTLAGRGLAVLSAEQADKTYLLGQGGRLAPWGPVITHLSFLLILAGAVVGSLFGFAGDMNVPEGSSASSVRLPDGGSVPLAFEIRCDEFQVNFYAGSQQPSEFRSDLAVLEQGREVLRKTIRVNDPLSYGGLRFYQSSYGQMPPGTGGGKVVLSVAPASGKPRSLEAPVGSPVPLDNQTSLLVRQFVAGFRIGADGHVQDSGQLENPAVHVALIQGSQVLQEGWRFARYPGFSKVKPGDWTIELKDLRSAEYTGLRVSYDPGVGLVYAGGILLSLGLMLSFLQRQRRIWARVEPLRDRVLLSLAGRTLRHSAALETEFASIVESLRPAPEPVPVAAKSNKKGRSRS